MFWSIAKMSIHLPRQILHQSHQDRTRVINNMDTISIPTEGSADGNTLKLDFRFPIYESDETAGLWHRLRRAAHLKAYDTLIFTFLSLREVSVHRHTLSLLTLVLQQPRCSSLASHSFHWRLAWPLLPPSIWMAGKCTAEVRCPGPLPFFLPLWGKHLGTNQRRTF